MKPETFIRFVKALPFSLDWKINEVRNIDRNFYRTFHREETPFPVGEFVNGGYIFFQHYSSFQEAIDAWLRRSMRLKKWIADNRNINIVLLCKDPSDQIINEFLNLHYDKKLLLIHDITGNSYDIHNDIFAMKNMNQNDFWFEYQHGMSIKKFYEQFDFANWVH